MSKTKHQIFQKCFSNLVKKLPCFEAKITRPTRAMLPQEKKAIKKFLKCQERIPFVWKIQMGMHYSNSAVASFGLELVQLLASHGVRILESMRIELLQFTEDSSLLGKETYVYIVYLEGAATFYAGGDNYTSGGKLASTSMKKIFHMLEQKSPLVLEVKKIQAPTSRVFYEYLQGQSKIGVP